MRPMIRWLILSVVVAGGTVTGLRGTGPFTTALTFPITSDRSEYRLEIGREIVLLVQRDVDAEGRLVGWDFEARDRRLSDSPNFFYAYAFAHGPQPHQLYAWQFIARTFPPERILPVYGYPLEVRVKCLDCQVAGEGATAARFRGGTVEVAWRRLATSNPLPRR